MHDKLEFPWEQAAIVRHSQRLLRSFEHWTGKQLLEMEGAPEAIAQALFEAPFVVTSHGTEADPVLNYGNRKALELWQMNWQQFTQTPSRYTAEPMQREERAHLLEQARQQGFISNYEGIRISSQGQRFRIQDVIVWDVLDEHNICCGQAATFSSWIFLA